MKLTTRYLRNWLTAGSLFALSIAVFNLPAFSAPADSGATTYKAKCAMCHGADGSAATPMGKNFKISDLRSAQVQKQSNADLTGIITNGKTPMPAYGKSLAAADIQQLVAYIRSIAAKT